MKKRFMKPIFLLVFTCLQVYLIQAQDPYYHTVAAQKGDIIYTFLDRYDLANYRCNYDLFYELNELNRNSQLVADKTYKIPVLIYTYNNKSIRSTIGSDNWAQAVRIKTYNEQLKANKLRKSTIVDSRILWVPYHELNCFNDRISDQEALIIQQPNETTQNIESGKSGARHFPIFGKKHAYVPLIDNSLKGKVFYIVGGHGGPDPGAIGKVRGKEIHEDEYAYDVALRLCRNLIAHGALAYMITRDPNDGIRSQQILKGDKDEYCWGNFKIPLSQKRRLFQRSDAINERYEVHKKQGLTDQVYVCIHIDSRSKGQNTDVFFYHHPNSPNGKTLANNMQQTLKAKYKKYNPKRVYTGTVTARDLHMLRETKGTGVYIELGNIRNKNDQKRFLLESNRQALADWLYAGLIK